MFTILLHSSKTMRTGHVETPHVSRPRFIDQAEELANAIAATDVRTVARLMKVSDTLAVSTLQMMQDWRHDGGIAAIDAFSGDIYSGLRAPSFSGADREYANETLVILSGLYGLLRPLDAVRSYRLEMAYKLPEPYENLYRFWGSLLAESLPNDRTIINTSSAEYTKALLPYLPDRRIVTPKFLTNSPKTGEPTFVTVHAKIARGAFARWLILNRVESEEDFKEFADLGYVYDESLSTDLEPVYVAETFGGIGLSIRLK